MKHQRIEVTTTDGTAWLERLSPRQMIAIGDCLWSEQRKRLIQDMKDADIESAERMKALEIIEEASKGKNAENADGLPDNFEGTSEEAMRIALDLIGAELGDDSKKESKSKKKVVEKKPRWVTNSALISRYFAGFGNPLDLPIDLFLLLLDRIAYVRQLDSDAPMDDRQYVEFIANFESFEE